MWENTTRTVAHSLIRKLRHNALARVSFLCTRSERVSYLHALMPCMHARIHPCICAHAQTYGGMHNHQRIAGKVLRGRKERQGWKEDGRERIFKDGKESGRRIVGARVCLLSLLAAGSRALTTCEHLLQIFHCTRRRASPREWRSSRSRVMIRPQLPWRRRNIKSMASRVKCISLCRGRIGAAAVDPCGVSRMCLTLTWPDSCTRKV